MSSSLMTELSQAIGRLQPVRPAAERDGTESEKKAPSPAVRDPKAHESDEPRVDRAQADDVIVKALGADFPSGASLQIDIVEETGQFVYKAVDRETGEVLKQFPPEQVLEQLGRRAKVQGIALDGSV